MCARSACLSCALVSSAPSDRHSGVIQLTHLCAAARLPISVNQIEHSPYIRHPEIVEFCELKGIVVQAFAPLGVGRCVQDKAVQAIAHAHGKTSAQILLRWVLDQGHALVVKAESPDHMRTNLELDGIALTEDDRRVLDSLRRPITESAF